MATKASRTGKEHPLAADEIRAAAERSLRNLRVDTIDLYYAHWDDPTTPLEESLTAFDELVQAGKVRHVAASNYSAKRLTEALETSERLGVVRVHGPADALQPDGAGRVRGRAAGPARRPGDGRAAVLQPRQGLPDRQVPGRSSRSTRRGPRARRRTWGSAGDRVLAALAEVARAHDVPMPAVALRWLADQPTVVAPIASARNVEQLAGLLPMQDLVLADDERQVLTDASA